MIADIGLVGVPNAGKSTLLSVLTSAKPKIAPYPFTTLQPNLGVGTVDADKTLVLADIPGLTEGASARRPAGLRLSAAHRTHARAYLPFGRISPLQIHWRIMPRSTPRWRCSTRGSTEKPQVVAVNKCDQPEVMERWPELKKQFKKMKVDVMLVSGMA